MQRREKGTGTVYRRDNGTWVGRMNLGRGEDGKIKYKQVRFREIGSRGKTQDQGTV